MEGSKDGSRETREEAPARIQARDDGAWPSVVAMEVASVGVWVYFEDNGICLRIKCEHEKKGGVKEPQGFLT